MWFFFFSLLVNILHNSWGVQRWSLDYREIRFYETFSGVIRIFNNISKRFKDNMYFLYFLISQFSQNNIHWIYVCIYIYRDTKCIYTQLFFHFSAPSMSSLLFLRSLKLETNIQVLGEWVNMVCFFLVLCKFSHPNLITCSTFLFSKKPAF